MRIPPQAEITNHYYRDLTIEELLMCEEQRLLNSAVVKSWNWLPWIQINAAFNWKLHALCGNSLLNSVEALGLLGRTKIIISAQMDKALVLVRCSHHLTGDRYQAICSKGAYM